MEDKPTTFSLLGYPCSTRSLLIIVLILAASLRIWGIDYGLPYEGITYDQLTYEETQEVHRAFKLAAGEYAWVFGKGGLYFILFVEAGFYYLVSLASGWVNNPQEFAVQVLQDRTPMYVMGRLTNVLLGLLTYVVIFGLGKKLYGTRVGLVAATIGAFAYLHGVFSTVINVDIGMVLALWASIFMYAHYEESGLTRHLIGAGLLGGIAIAFKLPGAVILPIVILAMASIPENWKSPLALMKNSTIFVSALLLSLTVVAPEWIAGIGKVVSNNFFGIIGQSTSAPPADVSIDHAIKSVSVVRHGNKLGYLNQLFRDYNLATTIFAIIGFAGAVIRRNRWDLIFGIFAIVFVVVMSQSWRTQSQHYLLPIMPALWLLSSRAVVALYQHRRYYGQIALLLILAVPVTKLIRHDVEKSYPDTRIVAKEWIEANVESNSKILIDGMQFRLIPSPPLQPNVDALSRQVERAASKGQRIGRGLSERTLKIYQAALSDVEGPVYDIYSTMHGVNVESLTHYVNECFDFVITSSMVSNRYRPEQERRSSL